MKIHKRTIRGEIRWVVETGSAMDGTRKRLSHATKVEAEATLEALVREVEQVGSDVLALSPAERLDVSKALRIARQGGFNLVDASLAYSDSRPCQNATTLGESVVEFLGAKNGTGKRQAYLQTLKNKVELFARGRESMRLADVTPEIVREFLSPSRYAPATLQGMRRRLSTFFSWCVKRRKLTRNPMEQVEGISVPTPPPKILTVEACERLLRAAETVDRGLLPWLTLGLFCGVRPDEIRRLNWDAMKVDRGFVEVSGEASKVRARRLVRLAPNAVEWLKLGGDLPPVNFWRRIRKVRAAAGMADWPADVLRHTAASMMLARDRDAAAVALELGNSPEILFRHYRELVTREDSARFWAILPATPTTTA